MILSCKKWKYYRHLFSTSKLSMIPITNWACEIGCSIDFLRYKSSTVLGTLKTLGWSDRLLWSWCCAWQWHSISNGGQKLCSNQLKHSPICTSSSNLWWGLLSDSKSWKQLLHCLHLHYRLNLLTLPSSKSFGEKSKLQVNS